MRPREAEEPVSEARRDPLVLLSRAAELARAGRAPDSLRAAQEACVLALRGLGLLPEDPGLTDLEGVARLGNAPENVRSGYRKVTEAHDRVVYGGRAVPGDSLREAVDAATTVVRSAGEPDESADR